MPQLRDGSSHACASITDRRRDSSCIPTSRSAGCPLVEQEESRDAADAVVGREPPVRVDVDRRYGRVGLGGDPLDDRRNRRRLS